MTTTTTSPIFDALLPQLGFTKAQIAALVAATAHLPTEQQSRIAGSLYDVGSRAEYVFDAERELARRMASLQDRQGGIAYDIHSLLSLTNAVIDQKALYFGSKDKFFAIAAFVGVRITADMLPGIFSAIH
jgi:hypothetical protein